MTTSGGIKGSNTSVQLNLHDELVTRMLDAGIPMLGGISGTTRDIFSMLDSLLPEYSFDYWDFFSVVAAFMIKHHYRLTAYRTAPRSGAGPAPTRGM